MTYQEYRKIQPVMNDCFFAFNQEQFIAGIRKHCLNGLKIKTTGFGLYGTESGILDFFKQYEDIDKQIKENCIPQDVYDYEYNNHECSYTNDDTEVLKIIERIFGKEAVYIIKRKYGFRSLKTE